MDLLDLNLSRKKYLDYLSALGAFFHYSSSKTIAEASLNPTYKSFVSDYLKMVCLPGFAKEVEEKREEMLVASKLEGVVQSSPKCIDSASAEERYRWIETEEAQDFR